MVMENLWTWVMKNMYSTPPNRDNSDLGRHGKGSTKRTKGGGWLPNPFPELVCLQTFKTIRVGPCTTLLSSVAFNNLETNLKLDSHDDTSCLGEGVLVLTDYEIPVHVQVCGPALGTHTWRAIGRALLYDHPYMGHTYHIVIHQAVEIPNFTHHMLFPIHIRTNRVTVNDCPRFLTNHPTEETHAIISDDEGGNKVFYLYVYLGSLIIYLFIRWLIMNKLTPMGWQLEGTVEIVLWIVSYRDQNLSIRTRT